MPQRAPPFPLYYSGDEVEVCQKALVNNVLAQDLGQANTEINESVSCPSGMEDQER